jgi:uncharacterized iron-regulated membrane protein
MHKGPGRFELILNLPEVIALFFVMVALFTGLLFFGYRVGYMQSAKAASGPPRPAAPAQESPQVDQQTPAAEVEPELRLENSPAGPGDPRFEPSEPGSPDPAGREPLALHAGENPRRPCKADSYLSLLQKTIPAKHRLGERLVEWAVAQWAVAQWADTQWAPTQWAPTQSAGGQSEKATSSGREPSADPEPSIAAESAAVEPQGREPEAVDCGAPVDPRAARSFAC